MSSVTNLEYLVYLNETLGPQFMKWGEDEIDPSWDVIHLPPPPPPCMGDGTYFPRSSEHVNGFWILPAHVVLQLYFTHCADDASLVGTVGKKGGSSKHWTKDKPIVMLLVPGGHGCKKAVEIVEVILTNTIGAPTFDVTRDKLAAFTPKEATGLSSIQAVKVLFGTGNGEGEDMAFRRRDKVVHDLFVTTNNHKV
eukprot:PhF_6_TR5603/c0_g1_i1/m.8067